MVLEDIDRHNKEVLHQLEHHGAELLAGSWLQQLALAVSAGSFITMAAALAAVLSTNVETYGASKFMQGLAFTSGFFMVVLSGEWAWVYHISGSRCVGLKGYAGLSHS
jgi:formate/nitrite transporter FocA (FNT family)